MEQQWLCGFAWFLFRFVPEEPERTRNGMEQRNRSGASVGIFSAFKSIFLTVSTVRHGDIESLPPLKGGREIQKKSPADVRTGSGIPA